MQEQLDHEQGSDREPNSSVGEKIDCPVRCQDEYIVLINNAAALLAINVPLCTTLLARRRS
jgi:hypothetical protein